MTDSDMLPSGPAADAADDPRAHRILIAHFIAGYALSFAAVALLMGKPALALGAWLIDLPIVGYALMLQARSLGRSAWLGLLCAPLAPFGGRLLRWFCAAPKRHAPAQTPAQAPSPAPPPAHVEAVEESQRRLA